jgi:hypothetical protein
VQGRKVCEACLEYFRGHTRYQHEWNKKNGYCLHATSHGPATKGVYCEACADKNRRRDKVAARPL